MAKQDASYRPDQAGGTQDISHAEKLVMPAVVPTTQEALNQHGPGQWDNNVYGGDPYTDSLDATEALDNAGPS